MKVYASFFMVFPYMLSNTSPLKTIPVPSHCLGIRVLPKNSTLPRIVKNFLVVVMMLHIRGPNSVTVMKMKFCPIALARPKVMR